MPEEEPLPDNPFKRKMEEDRRRRKAEAEAKAAEAEAKKAAKKAAKKKANQAPEDDWFTGGAAGGDSAAGAESDDDDMGFRMFNKDDLETAPIDKAQAKASFKPMKVTNLIDFTECDLPDEDEPIPPPAPADAGGGSPSVPSLAPTAASRGGAPAQFAAASLPVPMGPGAGLSPRPSLSRANTADQTFFDNRSQQEANYISEIEHLQQMLRDANEEKMISVAIIQDDVEEKKQFIADLTRKQAESEVELQIARDRIRELEVQQFKPAPAHEDEPAAFPDHWGAMGKTTTDATVAERKGSDAASTLALSAVMEEAEAQKLEFQAEVARLKGELESKTQALHENEALKVEVEKLRAAGMPQVPEGAPKVEVLQAEVSKLQAEAQAQNEALLSAEKARAEARAEAERSRKEAEEAKRAANEQVSAAVSTSDQLPPASAALLREMHDLCERARQSLGGSCEAPSQQASSDADTDAKMRCLRDAVAALQVSAELAAAERKRLATKAENLQRANAGAVSKSLESAPELAPQALPATSPAGMNGTAASPHLSDDEALRAEAQAAAEVLGKHAAQALREVRLNAERQLAWISKRINMKVDLAAPGATLGGAGVSPAPQADAGT